MPITRIADVQCGDPAARGKLNSRLGRVRGTQEIRVPRTTGTAAALYMALHVNTLHPHSQGLLPLCVAQVSRQKRPLLPAEGDIWVTGRPLGRRRGCRRAGWRRAAGWRWWQARCIREGILEGGCRERHAVVPCACKPLLTGLHLCREQGCAVFSGGSGWRLRLTSDGAPATLASQPASANQPALAGHILTGLAFDIGLHPREGYRGRLAHHRRNWLLQLRCRHGVAH